MVVGVLGSGYCHRYNCRFAGVIMAAVKSLVQRSGCTREDNMRWHDYN